MSLRKPDLGWRGLGAGFLALAVLLALIIGLTNCGGSGGGAGDDDDGISGSTTYSGNDGTATVDDGNGTDAAAAGVDSYSMGTDTSGKGENIASGVSVETAKKAEGLAASALEAYRSGQEQGLFSGSSKLAGVTESCPDGGSASTNWLSDDNVQEELDAPGDKVEISFDNCQIDPIVYDGGFTLTLNHLDTSDGTRELTMEFNNWLIGQDGEAITGANGVLRFRTGEFAVSFPEGHRSGEGFEPPTNSTDKQFTIGTKDDPLHLVDNPGNWSARITDLNFYVSDGKDDLDGVVDYDKTWHLVYHGSPAEICTTPLDGCIEVNHTQTTGFTFSEGYPYPTSGMLQIDGEGGSYVNLDPDNNGTPPERVWLKVDDGSGSPLAVNRDIQWSDLGNY